MMELDQVRIAPVNCQLSIEDDDKENAYKTRISTPDGDETRHVGFASLSDDVNNNCAKFLNRHKSLDLTASVLNNEQRHQSLSSSKLMLQHSASQDDNDEAVRVSLALLRPGTRNSSVDMLNPIRRAIATKSSGSTAFLSNQNSSNSTFGGIMDESQSQVCMNECNELYRSSSANTPGNYQPILESSLTRVHKFLRDKKVYSADYNPKFKRRTVVLIKPKSSAGFSKSTSSSNLVHSSSTANFKASSKQGSFGFNLQSYGVLNPATMQVEYICFVSNVQPDSSAKKAGLENGDVVLSIDNIQIDEFKSLKEILEHVKNKTELKLVIITENVCKKIKYQQRIEQLKATLKQKYDELEALNAQEAEIMKKYNLDKNQLLRAKLSVFRSFSDGSSSNNLLENGANMYSSFSESSVTSDEKPAQTPTTTRNDAAVVLSAGKSNVASESIEPIDSGRSSQDDHVVLQAKRGSLMVKGSRSSSHRTSLNFTSSSFGNEVNAAKLHKGGNAKSSSGFKLLPNSFSKLNNYKVAATTTAANTSKINHKSHSNLAINTNAHSLNPIPTTTATLSGASSSTTAFFASPDPQLQHQSSTEATASQSAGPSANNAANNSKAKSFAKKFIFSNRIVRSASSSSMNLLSNLKFANGGASSKKSSNAAKKPVFSPLSSMVDDPASTAQLQPASKHEQRAVDHQRLRSLDNKSDQAGAEKIVLDSVINRLSLEPEPNRVEAEDKQAALWTANSISPVPSSSSRSSLASSSIQSAKKMFAVLDNAATSGDSGPRVQDLIVESGVSFDSCKIAPLAGVEASDSPSNSLEHESKCDATNSLSSSHPVQQANDAENEFDQLATRALVSSPSTDTDKSFKSVVMDSNTSSSQLLNSSLSNSSNASSSKYKSLATSNNESSSSLLFFSPMSRDVSEVYINLNIDSTHNNESTDDSCYVVIDQVSSPAHRDAKPRRPESHENHGEQLEADEADDGEEISNKLALLDTRNSFNYSSSATNKDSLSSSSTSTISTFSNNSSSTSTNNRGVSEMLADPSLDPGAKKPDDEFLLPIRPGAALMTNRDQDYIVTRL